MQSAMQINATQLSKIIPHYSGEKSCSPIREELLVEQQEGKGLQPLLAQGSASFDDPLFI